MEDLKSEGLLEKIEDLSHSVDTAIAVMLLCPMVSKQWFVR